MAANCLGRCLIFDTRDQKFDIFGDLETPRSLAGSMMSTKGSLYVFLGYDDMYRSVKTIEQHIMHHGMHFHTISVTDSYNFLCGEKFLTYIYSRNTILIMGGFKQQILTFNPSSKTINDSGIQLKLPDHFSYAHQCVNIHSNIYIIGDHHCHIFNT